MSQSNLGILWLTSFGGGLEGSKDLSESVTRVKAIHVKKDLNIVLYEVWSTTEYIQTMIMAVDDVGVVIESALDVGYALRLGPTDELYLSDDDEGVIVGYSSSESSYQNDPSKITRFEICYKCESSSSPPSLSTIGSTAPSKAPSKAVTSPSDVPLTAPSDDSSFSPSTFPSTAPSKAPVTSALPKTVFWNNADWPSDISGGELEATVLFAQSQIIPSKNGVDSDKQPHLTALRKTLVMFRPHNQNIDTSNTIGMTVRDVNGRVLSGYNPILLNDPDDIPKQDGWIDLGGETPNFPPSLKSPFVIQGQSELNDIGNDPQAVSLTKILNTPNRNEVEIKTADGSFVPDIYFPDGSNVPEGSKIQISCTSTYSVNVHYPNAQTGGWRSRSVSNGKVLVVILMSNNVWVAEDDLPHTEYVFGHGFYTSTLDSKWLLPGMTIEFSTQNGKAGTLDNIEIGGVTEVVITAIDAGFLTEPRNKFIFRDDASTHREYFETLPVTRLVIAQYESMHLTEVMLPTGKLYDTKSDDDGGWQSGDMRWYTGKLLISHGIDLANYGISSSWAQSESPHPFTCALLAAHNTVGMYKNGRQVHGGSGGNGIVTLDESVGNELSHEVGHNYGLGHYVDGFDGSVHRPSDKINSSWGWDSEYNIFIPNFASSDTGEDQCLDDQCQSPFLGKYQYGTDSMASGSPQWGSNRFTFYTPNTSRIIQNFLESRAVWDPTSSTGFRKYSSSTKKMEEFLNNDNGNKVP